MEKQLKFDLSDIPYCKHCSKCCIEFKECSGPSCTCCEFYEERYGVKDKYNNYITDEFGEEWDYFHSWCTLHLCIISPENNVCKQFR